MKKVTVQFNAPVNVEVLVGELSEDAILNAAWEDLRSKDSLNSWRPEYSDLKEIVRSACFLDEDIEQLPNESGDFFIVAYI